MYHKCIRRKRAARIMIKNASRKLSTTTTLIAKQRKNKIPAALREQVWLHHCGRRFDNKCRVTWCQNKITVFDFQCGHIQAEAQGGPTVLENLIPLCQRCNQSMGTMHFDQWTKFGGSRITLWQKLCNWMKLHY